MAGDPRPEQGPTQTAPTRAAALSSAVEAAVVLGWDMASLYAFATPRRLARPEFPHPVPPPALTNLSQMDARPRLELQLDGIDVRIRFLVARLTDAPAAPSTTHARSLLTELGTHTDAGQRFRRALDDLNLSLLSWLIPTDSRIGTAYRLGRSLAESCQDKPDRLRDLFCSGRGKTMTDWLEDLATALPPYSSTVVRGSFGRWRQAVSDPTATVRSLGGTRRTPAVPEHYDRRLSAALPDQGRLWRNILTGDLDPRDLLTEADYQQHIERLLVRDRALLLSSARRLFIPILLPLVVVVALAVTVVALTKTGTPLAQAAAALVAVGGGAVAAWKLVSASAAHALATVNEPLREAQLGDLMAQRASRPLEAAIQRSLRDVLAAPPGAPPPAVPPQEMPLPDAPHDPELRARPSGHANPPTPDAAVGATGNGRSASSSRPSS